MEISLPYFTSTIKNKLLSRDRLYLVLVLAHILIGGLLYSSSLLSLLYDIGIIAAGLFYIISNRNQNHEVLQVAAYCIGSEVFIRMTPGGFLSYESMKYFTVVLAILGIFYSGFSKKTLPYWIYLLALVPSIVFEESFKNLSREFLRVLALDLSGPICLGFVSIYCLDKKISARQFNKVLLAVGFPILSCVTYVFLYNPPITEIVGVESNADFAGGWGPNQVATTLGLGVVIFFIQFVLHSATKIAFVVNLLLFSTLCYFGLLTFSRGGTITGLLVCVVFLVSMYFNVKSYGKRKLRQGFLYLMAAFLAVFTLIAYQTDGLIIKRYTNRDHLGRTKRDKPLDRKELAKAEIKMFVENPVMGIGAAKGNAIRHEKYGRKVNSHDEFTRLLAEHGMFGLLNILILVIVPLLWFFKYRANVFLITLLAFWFLTINHSSMRIAAPSFIYALMLLSVRTEKMAFFTREIPGRT